MGAEVEAGGSIAERWKIPDRKHPEQWNSVHLPAFLVIIRRMLSGSSPRLVFTLLVVAVAPAFAAEAKSRWDWTDWRKGPPAWATAEDIEAAKHLKNVQLWISGFNEAKPDPSHNFRYEWQVRFARAAQAQGEIDTPEEIERLRRVWHRFEEKGLFDVSSVQFDVIHGSLLKYAAIRGSDTFVRFAAEFKLGLTRVDESDGRTILDYLEYHIDRAKGSAMAETWKEYYERLRDAGAKHRRELP